MSLSLTMLKPINVCRLAFLGFSAQYAATGKGPLENLGDHLKQPFVVSFLASTTLFWCEAVLPINCCRL